MKNLAAAISTLGRFRRRSLIFALHEKKNAPEILAQIVPLMDEVAITRFENLFKKCYSPKALLSIARRYSKKTRRLLFRWTAAAC
jgi:folylpolyglutamate synthase/dihydropteroate synthase